MAGKVFRYKIRGGAELRRNLRLLANQAPPAAKLALTEEAETVMTLSKGQVPVDQGILRSTGHVAAPVIRGRTVSTQAAYGGPAAPYALSVHENSRAGHTRGLRPHQSLIARVADQSHPYRKTWAQTGKWKYLEDPYNARLPGMAERIGARMGGILIGSVRR